MYLPGFVENLIRSSSWKFAQMAPMADRRKKFISCHISSSFVSHRTLVMNFGHILLKTRMFLFIRVPTLMRRFLLWLPLAENIFFTHSLDTPGDLMVVFKNTNLPLDSLPNCLATVGGEKTLTVPDSCIHGSILWPQPCWV